MGARTEVSAVIIIVSPHRDDAAFSCGLLMYSALRNRSVRVVNVFTRSAYAPFAAEVERQGTDAVAGLRIQEDADAFELLRSTAGPNAELTEADLGLLDAPLRLRLLTQDVQGDALDADSHEREVETLAAFLHPVLEDAACVLLPLGLGGGALKGHIDHQIARDAGRRCVAPDRIAFYEDLPYAARMPQPDRDSAIRIFTSTLDGIRPLLIKYEGVGYLKLQLARRYPSQIDAATMEEVALYTTMLGGERVYAATAARGLLETLSE